MKAEPSEAPGIEATARLLGAYAWIEGRLFEVLGESAGRGGAPEASAFLDAQSQQHAWHASLFADRIPSLPGLDRSGLTASPSPAVGALLDALAGATSAADAVALSARVLLPRLVTGYRLHLHRTRAASDSAVVRALRLVVRDDIEALLDAEALLEAHLAEGGAMDTRTLGSVEDGLVLGGPGLVPWTA